jgi:hypothetical protein
VIFPGVIVCNNNQFRRSFVYWIINNLKNQGDLNVDPIIKNGAKRMLTDEEQKVFDFIREYFFEGSEFSKTNQTGKLKNAVFESNFMKNYFSSFISHRKTKFFKEFDGIKTTIFNLASNVLRHNNETLFEFGPEMFVAAMAGQWKREQMIPYIQWKGTLNKTEKNLFAILGPSQPTTSGVCSWIAPYARKFEKNNAKWPVGALSGKNNGLTLYLDTESYDYVENDKGGLGFEIAISHPMDMAIMEQNTVSVKPGTANQLAVSVALTTTTTATIQRFSPIERNCWKESEINFRFIPYVDFYRYSMTNCLYEAAMQEANKTCGCVPGHIRLSKTPCFDKSLKCFNDIIENLGK